MMRKFLTGAVAAVIVLSAGGAAAVSADLVAGQKRIGNIGRVHAMTRAGEPHATAASLRQKAVTANARYSTVNASLQFTTDSRRTRRMMYSVNPTSGVISLVSVNAGEIHASGGAVMIDGKYYCMTRLKVLRDIRTRFYVYDADTWERERFEDNLPQTLNATDVAYDPTTGRVFGCFYDSAGEWSIGTIDYATLTRTSLASSPCMNAMAADDRGNLYAIDLDGMLYSVDKLSGQLASIGDTGIHAEWSEPDWQGTATYDPLSGKIIYAACCTGESEPEAGAAGAAMWTVDPADASVERIMSFSTYDMFDGMYIPLPELADDVPQAPENLQASFPGGALSGTVSFTMPSRLVGGGAPAGNMSYTLRANGETVAEGEAAPGAAVSCDVTLERGSYCFSATASNSGGVSRAATKVVFVGTDNPAMPQVTATYDYTTSTMSLSWPAVKTTEFGTPLADGEVSYRIVRYPGAVEVAPALAATSFSEVLNSVEPEGITYQVEAVAAGLASGAAMTSPIYIGAFTPLYEEDFTDSDGFRYYTVADADADGLTWRVSTVDRAAYMGWNNNAADGETKDDWLFSPGIRMEPGKVYHLSFGERKLYDPETLTVMMGRNPRIAAMERTLLAAHQVTEERAVERTVEITVDAAGIYFIGFHATSPRNSGALYVSGLSVSEGIVADAPKCVTGLTATPAADRSHSVRLDFTAPSENMAGSPLSSLSGIDIYRDGEKIGEATAAPGASGYYIDNGAHQGMNSYTVRPCNAAGVGSPAEVSVFVGWDEPNSVERVRARETDTDGLVTVTWQAPELDNNNSPLTDEALRYDVFMTSRSAAGTETRQVGTDVRGTSHEVTVCSPSEQRFAEFSVVAKTEGGQAREVFTPEFIPAGKADEAPFVESFKGAREEHFWGYYDDYSLGCTWYVTDDYTFDLTSQDADNGFLVMESESAGSQAEIYSSKISLEGLEAPVLSFYSYNLKGSGENLNNNTIEISVYDGAEKKSVKTVTMADYNEDGWQRISVSLADYAGKDVQLLLKGTIVNFLTIAIDNIRVDDSFERNLTASSMETPFKTMVDKPFTAVAKVENTGRVSMEPYTLDFYRGETKLETRAGKALEPGRTETFEFECVHDITSEPTVEYRFVISCPGDMNEADNTSRRSQVRVCLPEYPVVTTLAAAHNSGKPVLVWEAPDLTSTEPFEIIEDFESYPAFTSADLWEWVLYDGDKGLIGGIEDANEGEIELPGIPSGSPQSWFTFDGEYEKLNFTYRAHSGRQHLATMYCYTVDDKGMGSEAQNDDWLISPVLAQGSDSFTFFARGYSYMAPDALEVLYTTDATSDPIMARYRSLGKIDPMPTTWDEYFVELPEGAARFALRSIGNFGFMLFVDDITFTPACGASMLTVEGYNVYRDGVRINETPVEEPRFTDSEASDGAHTYGVTAVYNRGESRLSNLVSTTSALGMPESDSIDITSRDGNIVITGATGKDVTVYTTDGRILFGTSEAAQTVRIPAAPGIYLVKAGDVTAKVLVK